MASIDGSGAATGTKPMVLFPNDLLQPRSVDSAFAAEYEAAVASGFRTEFVKQEPLDQGNYQKAVRAINASGLGIYRGWMLTVDQYASVYQALSDKGIGLINTPEQYCHCHWLPESFELIRERSPHSVWVEATEGGMSIDAVVEAAARLRRGPVVVRDFVKSRKHEWAEACFVPDTGDANQLRRVVSTFIERQGDALAGGVVLREFIELQRVGTHPKSGMPLTNEHRVFVLDGEPLLVARYWADADYVSEVPVEQFRGIMAKVRSRFFSMDVARAKDGVWWIVELGDGQVAGLLDTIKPTNFYPALVERLR